jgi:NMD protein affecting ribosome stability and mRNA decay
MLISWCGLSSQLDALPPDDGLCNSCDMEKMRSAGAPTATREGACAPRNSLAGALGQDWVVLFHWSLARIVSKRASTRAEILAESNGE